MSNANLFTTFDQWTIRDGINSDISNSIIISDDGRSCSYQVQSESAHIRYRLNDLTPYLGHTLKLRAENFTSSDNATMMEIRTYSDTSNDIYVRQRFTYRSGDLAQMPIEIDIEIPIDCVRLEIRLGHDYAAEGINPPATISISGLTLVDTYQESIDTLNFHKVLEKNLPESVTAGSQHIYFTSNGSTAKQYVSDKEGHLMPVISAESLNQTSYFNAYTQAHIDERKQDIVNLTRQGHCITFAVATDIHVRDAEDGESGRYDQVKDFIMLSNQLPIDYIFCEGDIMSYCQEWDKVFEPRCEKVRKIFDQCRSPWFVTRGNHDFNEDDNGFENNPNIKEYNASNCANYFITDRDWHRTIGSKMPVALNLEYHFDEDHPHNGYFYVDDYNHKHRMIFCNTEETMETDDGAPYINENGEIEATLSSVASLAQLNWLIDKALDMSNKTDWIVSLHSHKVPYNDREEDDCSEFHGYGWYSSSESFRKLINAFQTGTSFDFSVYAKNVDTHQGLDYERTVDFTNQGPVKVIGWFGGHIHDDCYKKVDGVNLHVSTCTCPSQRSSWSNDPNPIKLPPPRNETDLAMSVNVFVVNLDTRTVNVVKIGSKRDNSVKTSSDLTFTY